MVPLHQHPFVVHLQTRFLLPCSIFKDLSFEKSMDIIAGSTGFRKVRSESKVKGAKIISHE
jgi:hypothetical protein